MRRSWLLLMLLPGCLPATDVDVRWKSMTGVFEEVYSRRKLCLCTRGDALQSGKTDWLVSCTTDDLDDLMLLWQDDFPGPNRRILGRMGAVFMPHDTKKLQVPTTTGPTSLEYSSKVQARAELEASPRRRLFIDSLVLSVDPICQDRTGGSCERESRLEGFELWCDDTSVLVEER